MISTRTYTRFFASGLCARVFADAAGTARVELSPVLVPSLSASFTFCKDPPCTSRHPMRSLQFFIYFHLESDGVFVYAAYHLL